MEIKIIVSLLLGLSLLSFLFLLLLSRNHEKTRMSVKDRELAERVLLRGRTLNSDELVNELETKLKGDLK